MARTTIRSEDITAGQVTTAKMATDPTNASNLSSGDVPLAQLDNVPATDTSGLRNDISTLALHSAIADNKAAFNLTNAFIDQFEDDTGLDVETTCDRDATEYMGSSISGAATWGYNDGITIAYTLTGGSNTFTAANMEDNNTGTSPGWFSNGNADIYLAMDLVAARTVNKFEWYSLPYSGTMKNWKLQTSSDGSSWTTMDSGNTTNMVGNGNSTVNAGTGIATASNASGWNGLGFNARDIRYWRSWWVMPNYTNAEDDAMISEIKFAGTEVTTNAAGNFTSTTQTSAASVSSMGIVVLYKNNSGTATLNTDLVCQVSANGGTNYANATLVAGGTFSTGINIAAVSGVSVTAGTTPKYKISFANQSAGVKETQVHGVALLY